MIHVRNIISLIISNFYKGLYKLQYPISVGFILRITGTLVHGSIANSVTTAVTNSGGVTS